MRVWWGVQLWCTYTDVRGVSLSDMLFVDDISDDIYIYMYTRIFDRRHCCKDAWKWNLLLAVKLHFKEEETGISLLLHVWKAKRRFFAPQWRKKRSDEERRGRNDTASSPCATGERDDSTKKKKSTQEIHRRRTNKYVKGKRTNIWISLIRNGETSPRRWKTHHSSSVAPIQRGVLHRMYIYTYISLFFFFFLFFFHVILIDWWWLFLRFSHDIEERKTHHHSTHFYYTDNNTSPALEGTEDTDRANQWKSY